MHSKIVLQSMLARRTGIIIAIVIVSVALAVTLLCGSWALEGALRTGLSRTLVGTDLLVGAKGSPINLLLSSLLDMGSPLEGVSESTYRNIAKWPEVDWVVPLSFGDAHRSFRVVGTVGDFFEHFRFGQNESLKFAAGAWSDEPFTVVLGSRVAEELGYRLGQSLVLNHADSMITHAEKPFRVVGLLASTATPWDRSLFISMASMNGLHPEEDDHDVSALLVKLKSRYQILNLQNRVNTSKEESLTAVVPGMTFAEIWRNLAYVEKAFQILGALLLIVSLGTIFLSLYSSIEIRKREMAILRGLGAQPTFILNLFLAEGLLCLSVSIILALVLLKVGFFFAGSEISHFAEIVTPRTFWLFFSLALATAILSSIAAWQAYRRSLHRALTIDF